MLDYLYLPAPYLTTLSETLVLANIENRMNKPSVFSQLATRLATESWLFLSSTFFEMGQNKEQKSTKQKLYFFTNPKMFFYYFCFCR